MIAVVIVVSMAGPSTALAVATIVNVDCSLGTIADALTKKNPDGPLEVIVSGTCSENVFVARDDVTLRAQALGCATVDAANPGVATILIEGARRVRIENLTVSGGAGGIVGRRGATVDVANCIVENNTGFGVVAATSSTVTVDGSQVRGTSGIGIVAANGASVFVTASTVENNTGGGISGVRNAHVRVGQDINASPVVRPVTIRKNGGTNFLVTDASAGILVGGVVEQAIGSGVAVSRASSALIGLGIGLTAPTIVRNNRLDGIVAEGGYVTVVNTTISGNTRTGVDVTNAAAARIGIRSDVNAYAGNTITNNGSSGILVANNGSAFIGANTITANGTNAASVLGRSGIHVFDSAMANLAGDNVIQGNAGPGILAGRGATVLIGNPAFGLTTANTISDNGFGDPAKAGIFAFQGGIVDARDALIMGNHGAGIQAFENAVVEIRDSVVTGNVFASDGFNGGHGVVADLRSTVRLRQASDVSNNQGDGVRIDGGSAVVFAVETPPAPSTVNDNGGFGLNCFGTEASFRGDTSRIGANTAGAIAAGCTGF